VSHDEMKKAIANKEFVENVEVHGNLYGTSILAIESVIKHDKVCILDIDIQGVKSFQSLVASNELGLSPRFVFIAPPSFESLKSRLEKRNTETVEQVQIRLSRAKSELDWANEHKDRFDAIIVNDNIHDAYLKLKSKVSTWYPQLTIRDTVVQAE
jgi:guanylate kinase